MELQALYISIWFAVLIVVHALVFISTLEDEGEDRGGGGHRVPVPVPVGRT